MCWRYLTRLTGGSSTTDLIDEGCAKGAVIQAARVPGVKVQKVQIQMKARYQRGEAEGDEQGTRA